MNGKIIDRSIDVCVCYIWEKLMKRSETQKRQSEYSELTQKLNL